MRGVLLAGLVIAVVVGGCFGGPDPAAPSPGLEASGDGKTSTTGTASHSGSGAIAGNVSDANGRIRGALVQLGAAGPTVQTNQLGAYRFDNVPEGSHSLAVRDPPTNRSKSSLVQVLAGRTTIADFVLPRLGTTGTASPADPVQDASEATEQGVPGRHRFACDGETVEEPAPFQGRDEAFHRMTWGALKTGFRFAVAVPGVDGATLVYRVEDGPEITLDLQGRSDPLFVFDVLAPGQATGKQVICFHVVVDGVASSLHAARLGNGPTSWDELHARYSLNIYILAAEGVDRATLEAGLPVYAQTMWDASDGVMTAGVVFVHYGGAVQAAETYEACNTPAVSLNGALGGMSSTVCDNRFDIVFSYFENPLAAGSTPAWGIEQPYAVIVMNQLYEAGLLLASDANEIGKVLQHELGHYAKGLADYYASLAGGPDCYDAQTSISIMGSNRAATEYDDELHPCPNEAFIEADGQDYIPSWQLWQEGYPNVPDRLEIDPGPDGVGAYLGPAILDWS